MVGTGDVLFPSCFWYFLVRIKSAQRRCEGQAGRGQEKGYLMGSGGMDVCEQAGGATASGEMVGHLQACSDGCLWS